STDTLYPPVGYDVYQPIHSEQRIQFYSLNNELITPFENPKRVFRSKRRLFATHGLVESKSPKFDLFSDIEEEETTEIMTKTMEQYISKTRGNYGSGVARPKINDKTHFELKGQFLKELRENTFSGSKHEDANEHIENSLISLTYFISPRQIIDSKGVIPTKTVADAKVAIQEMAEYSQKWHNGTSSKARTIRNQGASIKTLEIQIGQISKVLQERGIGGLSGSIEPNPRDHVKSILTVDSSVIRHIGSGPYIVSDAQYNSLSFKTIPFPNRLHGYCCDNWKEARKVKILETYDHTLPQKEKDSMSFTLPCFIHNICFDKALVGLGASVSVMPFILYYSYLLSSNILTLVSIELADRRINHPGRVSLKDVLVKI
ncbi:hypothetical protein Tco_0604551, partial [Tanacetum coccineum]